MVFLTPAHRWAFNLPAGLAGQPCQIRTETLPLPAKDRIPLGQDSSPGHPKPTNAIQNMPEERLAAVLPDSACFLACPTRVKVSAILPASQCGALPSPFQCRGESLRRIRSSNLCSMALNHHVTRRKAITVT